MPKGNRLGRQLKVVVWKAKKKLKDHCTFFPDKNYGRSCCKPHDKAYEDPETSKWAADIEVASCVWDRDNKSLAVLMWIGLTTFGWVWRNKAARGKWYKFYNLYT